MIVSKGNHPQMAEQFRLVKYCTLPRYVVNPNKNISWIYENLWFLGFQLVSTTLSRIRITRHGAAPPGVDLRCPGQRGDSPRSTKPLGGPGFFWDPWEKPRKNIGKPWENQHFSYGNHGKTMGKLWKTSIFAKKLYGKTIGTPAFFLRKWENP